MQDSHYITTRAQDFTETLEASLPQIKFHAYIPRTEETEIPDLFLAGFITDQVLIGVYEIKAEQVRNDFIPHILSAAQFFRTAWSAEETRFYPSDVAQLYDAHRTRGDVWTRLA